MQPLISVKSDILPTSWKEKNYGRLRVAIEKMKHSL